MMDNNECYVCVRRSLIAFFAKNNLGDYGYDIKDFETVMSFVKKSYMMSEAYRVKCVKGEIKDEISYDSSI